MVDVSLVDLGSHTRTRSDLDSFSGKLAIETLKPAKIAHSAAGAPYFPEFPKLFVSISHSHARAVAVLSDKPVGIDIELIKPRGGPILDYILTSQERDMISNTYSHYEKIVLCWTIKEAVLKAEQLGLKIPLKRIRIKGISKDGVKIINLNNKKTWYCQSFKYNNFFISLAYNKPAYVNWNISSSISSTIYKVDIGTSSRQETHRLSA